VNAPTHFTGGALFPGVTPSYAKDTLAKVHASPESSAELRPHEQSRLCTEEFMLEAKVEQTTQKRFFAKVIYGTIPQLVCLHFDCC